MDWHHFGIARIRSSQNSSSRPSVILFINSFSTEITSTRCTHDWGVGKQRSIVRATLHQFVLDSNDFPCVANDVSSCPRSYLLPYTNSFSIAMAFPTAIVPAISSTFICTSFLNHSGPSLSTCIFASSLTFTGAASWT